MRRNRRGCLIIGIDFVFLARGFPCDGEEDASPAGGSFFRRQCQTSRRLKRVKYLRSKSPDRGYAPLLPVLHYEYFTVRLLGSSQKEPKRAPAGVVGLCAVRKRIRGGSLVPIRRPVCFAVRAQPRCAGAVGELCYSSLRASTRNLLVGAIRWGLRLVGRNDESAEAGMTRNA